MGKVFYQLGVIKVDEILAKWEKSWMKSIK